MADTEGAEGPGVGHEQRSRIGVGGSAAPTRSRAAAQRNGTCAGQEALDAPPSDRDVPQPLT